MYSGDFSYCFLLHYYIPFHKCILITSVGLCINAFHIYVLLTVYFIKILPASTEFFLLDLPFEGNL